MDEARAPRALKEKIFDVSNIRIQKILEMTQFGMLYLIGVTALCMVIDYMIPFDTKVEDESMFALMWYIILEIMLIMLGYFYLDKLIRAIPFGFQYSDDYIPNSRGEIQTARNLVLIPVLGASLPKFSKRVNELRYRFTRELKITQK